MDQHGDCQVCGREYRLNRGSGNIPSHRGCPGGRELPAAEDLSVIKRLAEENPSEYLSTYIWRVKCRMTPEDRREFEDAEAALDQCIRDLQDFMYFAHVVMVKYTTCRVCGKNVDGSTFEAAYRRLEAPLCSTECYHVEVFKRNGCCEKGKVIPCVCMHSWTCPEHGTFHIGTHD